MIVERVGAPVFGVLMAAGAGAAGVGVQPTVWQFLGYSFEAASMCAALGAAVITRAIIGMRGKTIGRATDWAVLFLVLLFTAAIIATMHANLLSGLLIGTGIAAIGEGLILFAEKKVRETMAALGIPPARPDDAAAIDRAMRDLDQIPDRKDSQ